MFTGIIENTAQLVSFEQAGTNVKFKFKCKLTPEFKVDQSISHNGVCLTVDAIANDASFYTVTAIDETLKKTNLGKLQSELESDLNNYLFPYLNKFETIQNVVSEYKEEKDPFIISKPIDLYYAIHQLNNGENK